MDDTFLKACFIIATVLTGMLCGASLDQSIKQLPARHILGMKSFSAYAKAADLKNGVPWYATLGIGAAVASISTVILVWKYHSNEPYAVPIYLGGVFAIGHTICTSQAAPAYHKQKEVKEDAELEKLFNKFEKIQILRSMFIALNVLSFAWVLTIIIKK